mmetsp:Transcript_24191/g.48928  ORF Transcript_24191/g.48928 Transcript_24191/m.48928 type:complete len:237 (-) Transcript_24191:2062-2772(-)
MISCTVKGALHIGHTTFPPSFIWIILSRQKSQKQWEHARSTRAFSASRSPRQIEHSKTAGPSSGPSADSRAPRSFWSKFFASSPVSGADFLLRPFELLSSRRTWCARSIRSGGTRCSESHTCRRRRRHSSTLEYSLRTADSPPPMSSPSYATRADSKIAQYAFSCASSSLILCTSTFFGGRVSMSNALVRRRQIVLINTRSFAMPSGFPSDIGLLIARMKICLSSTGLHPRNPRRL